MHIAFDRSMSRMHDNTQKLFMICSKSPRKKVGTRYTVWIHILHENFYDGKFEHHLYTIFLMFFFFLQKAQRTKVRSQARHRQIICNTNLKAFETVPLSGYRPNGRRSMVGRQVIRPELSLR